jgi:hypothetical protein
MRKTLGYMALGSAAWRGFRWYRGRKASSQRWGISQQPGSYRNDLDYGDDIDLRSPAEESSALRRERWE